MTVFDWHQNAWKELLGSRERLPHAILLCGREGIGKLALARALAQALLCEAPLPAGEPCGRCDSCRWIEAGSFHPDFRLVQPAAPDETGGEGDASPAAKKKPTQSISVHQVRALNDFLNIASHRGRGHVVLLQPAEAMNTAAANALLKNLEEPAAGTTFILVSHRPHHLLPTVVSRCMKVTLPEPSTEQAMAWLKAQPVSHPELALAQAGGAPLLAARLDDDHYWSGRKTLLDLLGARQFDPIAAAERVVDYPVEWVLLWLQQWSYDILFMININKIRYNIDYKKYISSSSVAMDARKVMRWHRQLLQLQRLANHPLNARLFIESMLSGYTGLTI
jgi:DNA polymerase-3 subunit delta'